MKYNIIASKNKRFFKLTIPDNVYKTTTYKDHCKKIIFNHNGIYKCLCGSCKILRTPEGHKRKWRDFASNFAFVNNAIPINCTPGNIRVLKTFSRFDTDAKQKGYLKKPKILNKRTGKYYESFNVCKNRSKYHTLSPMKISPVFDINGFLYGLTIEDAWQASKVFPWHLNNYVGDMKWYPSWHKWSRQCRFSGEGKRHRSKGNVVNNINKNIPLFSFYNGHRLSYFEARKCMYMPWLSDEIQNESAYLDLLYRHKSGQDIILLEPDGVHPEVAQDLTPTIIDQLYQDTSRPFGHGLVIASTLLDYKPWKK